MGLLCWLRLFASAQVTPGMAGLHAFLAYSPVIEYITSVCSDVFAAFASVLTVLYL